MGLKRLDQRERTTPGVARHDVGTTEAHRLVGARGGRGTDAVRMFGRREHRGAAGTRDDRPGGGLGVLGRPGLDGGEAGPGVAGGRPDRATRPSSRRSPASRSPAGSAVTATPPTRSRASSGRRRPPGAPRCSSPTTSPTATAGSTPRAGPRTTAPTATGWASSPRAWAGRSRSSSSSPTPCRRPSPSARARASRRAARRCSPSAVRTLTKSGGEVYIDAGNAGFVTDTGKLADGLRKAGVSDAAGFALNVSNFQDNEEVEAYGKKVSDQLGGSEVRHRHQPQRQRGLRRPAAADVVQPARPRPRHAPRPASTGDSRVAAFLWVKEPGRLRRRLPRRPEGRRLVGRTTR